MKIKPWLESVALCFQGRTFNCYCIIGYSLYVLNFQQLHSIQNKFPEYLVFGVCTISESRRLFPHTSLFFCFCLRVSIYHTSVTWLIFGECFLVHVAKRRDGIDKFRQRFKCFSEGESEFD